MESDWLQLTEEDIARAHLLTRDNPPMPDVITIRPADIPAETTAIPISSSEALLSITLDDLAPTLPQDETTADLGQLEVLMFELINQARQEHLPRWLGTSRLKWHDGLAAVARGHSADMLRRQYVAHISPEGITAARRMDGYGIGYVACGENIGVFYGTAAHTPQAIHEIHKAFINQPRSMTNHRGNLLNPIWTHVGIGVAYNPDGSLVATQNFISSPTRRLKGL